MSIGPTHISFYSPDTFTHFIGQSGIPLGSTVHIRRGVRDVHEIAHFLSHLPDINVMWVVRSVASKDERLCEISAHGCDHFRRLGECVLTYDEAIHLARLDSFVRPRRQVLLLESSARNINATGLLLRLLPTAAFIRTRTFKSTFRTERLH